MYLAQSNASPSALSSFLPLLLLLGVFWFLLVRPQQKQQQKRQAMLRELKRGDQVVTIGGLHGQITALDDETVRLRVAPDIELTFNRSAVGRVKSDEVQAVKDA